MFFRPTTVRDDRGKRILLTLRRTESERRLQKHDKRKARERARQAREKKTEKETAASWTARTWRRARAWPLYIIFGIGAMGGAAGFLAGAVLAASAPLIGIALLMGWDWRAGISITLGLGLLAGLVIGVRSRDQSRHEHARRLANIDVCGACGYPLEHLEPASDGMIACPECGAAWDRSSNDKSRCPACDEPLGFLNVTAPGVATCPECEHEFGFAPKPGASGSHPGTDA